MIRSPMFRRSLLAGFAAAALLSAPAMAQPGQKTGNQAPGFGAGGASMMSVPGLVSTNVGNATNIGAGIGNTAKQKATTVQGSAQGGAPGGIPGVSPLVSTNVGTATNVAAGIGNTAGQKLFGMQGNGVQVGLNFSGHGPLVSTNVGVATNVAAGLGNTAGQKVFGAQK